MTNIKLVDDDEETTLPPPPEEEDTDSGPHKPFAHGDFRLHQTTVATVSTLRRFEVRLSSTRGYFAQFAVDNELAAELVPQLERTIAQLNRQYARPPRPREAILLPLDAPGTDVFFSVADQPLIRVGHETDRLQMVLDSAKASLQVSMHVGVAEALLEFFRTAA